MQPRRRIQDALRARITVNAAYLTASNVLQYILLFATGILIARFLGADALGVYGLASAVGQIAYRVAGFGTTTIITRKISRGDDDAILQLQLGLGFRIATGIATLLVVELMAIALGYDVETQLALFLYNVGQGIAGIREISSCVYFGRESMRRPAVASALFRIVAFALTLGFTLARLDVNWSIFALLVGQLVATWYVLSGPERDARSMPIRFTWSAVRPLVSQSFPLAAAGIFTMINLRADTVILAQYVDKTELGKYSGAFALILAFAVVPNSLLPALFPAFARRFHSDRQAAVRLFLRSQLFNAVVGVLITTSLFWLSSWLMHLFYGAKLGDADGVLLVLGLAVPCMYLSYANTTFFNGCDRQDLNLWTAILAGVVNVGANFLLIPRYGIRGAAWATVLSEGAFFVVTTMIAVNLVRELRGRASYVASP